MRGALKSIWIFQHENLIKVYRDSCYNICILFVRNTLSCFCVNLMQSYETLSRENKLKPNIKTICIRICFRTSSRRQRKPNDSGRRTLQVWSCWKSFGASKFRTRASRSSGRPSATLPQDRQLRVMGGEGDLQQLRGSQVESSLSNVYIWLYRLVE